MNKSSGIYLDNKLVYQRHQRDYSVLGSTVVIRALYQENKKFFGCSPHPIYLIINDGIFYHFMSREDGLKRCQSWLKSNGIVELKNIKQEYQKKLVDFTKFSAVGDHKDLKRVMKKLWQYFINFTNVIFISYELPEYCGSKISIISSISRSFV